MADKIRIGVLVSGNGSNLQSIINTAEAGTLDAEITCVISNNAKAFALERAQKHQIPAFYLDHRSFPTREAFDTAIVDFLLQNKVQLVVMAGFNRIITAVLLDAFPMALMNIHPALLPSFPGKDAQRQALEHGVKITGCTVHFVDEGTDSGPIIIQAAVPAFDNDTEDSLSARILAEEHKIFPMAIQLFAEGRLSIQGRKVLVKPAPESGGNYLENPAA
jgi:phosphoribosylglycinamide formyltransferase 1